MASRAVLPTLLLAAFLAAAATSLPGPDDLQGEDKVQPFAGYELLPGLDSSEYKLHFLELRHWGPAAQMCQNEGAHLVVINSELEAEAILEMFNRVSPPTVGLDLMHVGIYDSFSEGEWHTITGGLVADEEYNEWEVGRPFVSIANNCGAINRNIQYSDIICDSSIYNLPFVCEKPITMISENFKHLPV